MNRSKKELSSFEEYIKTYMKVIKVRDVNYKYYSKIESHNYDKYTIEQFLIICKLDKMEELGYISSEVAKTLHEILDIKLEIDKTIGEESIKALYSKTYISEKLLELHKKSQEISDCLKNYHLTIEDFNFNDILDLMIKNENKEKQEKNISIRTKKID